MENVWVLRVWVLVLVLPLHTPFNPGPSVFLPVYFTVSVLEPAHAKSIITQEGTRQAKHTVMIMVISNSFLGWDIQRQDTKGLNELTIL